MCCAVCAFCHIDTGFEYLFALKQHLNRTIVNLQFLIQWAPTKMVHDIGVLIIMTSKNFWQLQCIWHQTRVTYLWCITDCSHWNHCIWSQELWEHNFLVLKNGLLFYRSMAEWVFLLHKMTIKGLIAVINQSILTVSQPWLGLCFIWCIIKPLFVILWRRNTYSTLDL